MEEIAAIAKEIGAAVVEDACHALATSSEAGRVGNCRFSDMTIFSFHPVKTIATGEGGMVTTNNPTLAQKLQRFRSHGMVRESEDYVDPSLSSDVDGGAAPWAYEMQALGFNYRLSDIQAALGLSQMRKLPAFATRRRALSLLYADALPEHIGHVHMNPGACPHLFIALDGFFTHAAPRGDAAPARSGHRRAGALHARASPALLQGALTARRFCPARKPITADASPCPSSPG